MSKCISRKRRKNLRRFDAGMAWKIIGFSRKVGGANKGLGEAPKAARGRSMKVRPTQSRKGVKGQLPLAGSRDSVPCGVWGNAPTVVRALSSKEEVDKRRRQRSVPASNFARPQTRPKLLFPQDSVKNLLFPDSPVHLGTFYKCIIPKTTKPQLRFAAGVFACFLCEINQNQRTPNHTLPKKA